MWVAHKMMKFALFSLSFFAFVWLSVVLERCVVWGFVYVQWIWLGFIWGVRIDSYWFNSCFCDWFVALPIILAILSNTLLNLNIQFVAHLLSKWVCCMSDGNEYSLCPMCPVRCPMMVGLLVAEIYYNRAPRGRKSGGNDSFPHPLTYRRQLGKWHFKALLCGKQVQKRVRAQEREKVRETVKQTMRTRQAVNRQEVERDKKW